MNPAEQIHGRQSRMDDARRERRFASAVGRRNEAQHWDLQLDDIEREEAEFIERISEEINH
jgi:hypothetical protein